MELSVLLANVQGRTVVVLLAIKQCCETLDVFLAVSVEPLAHFGAIYLAKALHLYFQKIAFGIKTIRYSSIPQSASSVQGLYELGAASSQVLVFELHYKICELMITAGFDRTKSPAPH